MALLGSVLNAGGARTGFAIALGVAAAVQCMSRWLGTVKATAVRRQPEREDRCGRGRGPVAGRRADGGSGSEPDSGCPVSGRELSASMLAEEAGVSRPTASAHLKKLSEGRLIAVRAEGRSRHYRLAGPNVADVLERLMELAPPEPITSLRASTHAAQLRRARSCYDHLAGQLGVGLMQSMLDRGFLRGGDGAIRPRRCRCGPPDVIRPRPRLPAHQQRATLPRRSRHPPPWRPAPS